MGTPISTGDVCVERDVISFDRCGSEGFINRMSIVLEGFNRRFPWTSATFTEFTDGTAVLEGHLENVDDSNLQFDVLVTFTGRTSSGVAVPHSCQIPDESNFYYYEDFTGQLIGQGGFAGGILNISEAGGNFQAGFGANVTSDDVSEFGGSSWFNVTVVAQPSNSAYVLSVDSSTDHQGDINLVMTGGMPDCLLDDTCTDADGDGVCAADDCNDNDASLPAAAGTACNDGNPDTENDVIGADGCSCAGTPITTGCNPTFVLSPGNITINGLNGAFNTIKILDVANGFLDIVNCFGDCPTPASFDLPAGPYILTVTVRDASGNILCDIENESFTIMDGCTPGATCNDGDVCTTGDVFDADCNCIGTPEPDNDNDGLCALEDCDDNDPNLPSVVGSTCDDGNPDTTGDVYQADGCTCAGVLEGACNPTATPEANAIVIAGMSGPFNVIQVFNTADWSTEINCWGSCYNQTLDVDPGNYFVRLKVLDDAYQVVCEIETNIVVDGSTFSIAPETEFLHLFAREENRAVGLNWVNNSEYRNDYFVIERSIDGVNFTELKTVDAFGYDNRTVTNYQDQDFQPVLGDGFYRVRQVFEDGSLRYSNVEKVSFDIDLTEVGVFPNPTESEVQLSLVNFEGRSAVVQIYSPLGVLMDAVSVDEIQESPLRFNVANYQAGLYTITVKVDQRKIFSKRFVKIGL